MLSDIEPVYRVSCTYDGAGPACKKFIIFDGDQLKEEIRDEVVRRGWVHNDGWICPECVEHRSRYGSS